METCIFFNFILRDKVSLSQWKYIEKTHPKVPGTPPPGTRNLPGPDPPLNRITDTCKNITFPQLRLRAVKIAVHIDPWWRSEKTFVFAFTFYSVCTTPKPNFRNQPRRQENTDFSWRPRRREARHLDSWHRTDLCRLAQIRARSDPTAGTGRLLVYLSPGTHRVSHWFYWPIHGEGRARDSD